MSGVVVSVVLAMHASTAAAGEAVAPAAWGLGTTQRFHVEAHGILPEQVEFKARRNAQV